MLGLTLRELTSALRSRHGLSAYHAEALFGTVYSEGHADVRGHPRFAARREEAALLAAEYAPELPVVESSVSDSEATKVTLRYADGAKVESVLVPMRRHETICLSCQVGCARGCLFCRTGAAGLTRDLSAAEIVAQLMVARFVLRREADHVVFMGMGEPMDNLAEVLQSIRVLTDQRGLAVPHSGISVSTVGEPAGIRALARLAASGPRSGWRNVHLAVSLSAPDDQVRKLLVPSSRSADMAEIRSALEEYCGANDGTRLFVSYVLVPGVNDRAEHATALAAYLRGLRSCVNLIPLNSGGGPFRSPTWEEVRAFFDALVGAGQLAKLRASRGNGIRAACGQLATPGPRAERVRAATAD